jgi:16S rRNA G527 N7-methylase RsmG
MCQISCYNGEVTLINRTVKKISFEFFSHSQLHIEEYDELVKQFQIVTVRTFLAYTPLCL